MGALLQFETQLEDCGACPMCGVQFAIPSNLLRARCKDHRHVWCPNGHIMVFKEDELDRLKKELAEKKCLLVTKERALQWERDATARARANEEAALRKVAAARSQITKIKNRVGNGVCPCCNRTFQNLMSHMATKHPDYSKEGPDT